MKYKFGKNSNLKLRTCDYRLIVLFTYALVNSPCDFSIVEGYRGEIQQNHYFVTGKSKLKFPQSKHNVFPSRAVDVYPIPSTTQNFKLLADHIKKCSEILGFKINWGGDWKTFHDMPHWEMV